MTLDFLDSGIDSLQKGFKNLIKYEELYYLEDSNTQRFYYLKDAILFIQHGIEILLKSIILSHNEFLIFSQIDDTVKKAYSEKNIKGLDSVFKTTFKNKIHTVSFVEAIERISLLPSIVLPITLKNKFTEIESYRNIIMHSEVHLEEFKITKTFDGLSDELDMFFYKSIGEKYKTISGYDILINNFKDFKEALTKNKLERKYETIEIFMDAFSKCDISLGVNEVKRITNINTVNKFFDLLFKSRLSFGADFYNGFTTGSAEQVKRINENGFSLFSGDNLSYYDFRFKSLIIYIPALINDSSPILFIESDIDQKATFETDCIKTYDNIEMVNSLYLKTALRFSMLMRNLNI